MSEISQPPRPKLKLSVGSKQNSFSEASAPASAGTPTTGPKIKIRSSLPPTPADPEAPTPSSATTKAGRQTKPTSKLIESKKRENSDDDDDVPLSASQPAKKIRLQVKGAPTTPGFSRAASGGLILKSKGKPPYHPPGDGYDSEASDRETDPTIEHQFVLRMMPGEHCDYIRKCMEENKIGVSRAQGGADLSIKWLENESRRAIIQVKGQQYVAVMVELPTITEGMKTWDRKTLMKAADLCHMLLVFQKVSSEDEARNVPLPPMVQSGFKWPHGLTPPMHDAVNQRFAKVIERSEIELKQAAVKKLLQADAAALSTSYELIDDTRRQRSDDEDGAGGDMQYSEEEEDADGEDDEGGYFPATGYPEGGIIEADDDMDLEAEMEAALFEDGDADQQQAATEGATPAVAFEADGVTPATLGSGTPAAMASANDEEDDEESVVSEEDDSEGSGDDNEEHTRIKGVKEDIANLKKQIAQAEAEAAQHANNKILARRVESRLKNLKAELRIKYQSLGQDEDGEDEE